MEPEWISLNEFMRRNKMGYEAAIRLIQNGKVEYDKKDNGQYKIKVSKSEKIDEFTSELIKENAELKATIKNMQSILNTVQV